eukprot:m.45162 g.45162  ORF g.45162 m.45162 type:complete len:63 (+) comp47196_c0_seq1:1005-1193(+)
MIKLSLPFANLFRCGYCRKLHWQCKEAAHCGLYNVFPEEYERRVLDFIFDAVRTAKQGRLAK